MWNVRLRSKKNKRFIQLKSVQSNDVKTETKEQEEQIIYSIEKDKSNDIENKECDHQNIFLDDENEKCSSVAINVVYSIANLSPPKDPGKWP